MRRLLPTALLALGLLIATLAASAPVFADPETPTAAVAESAPADDAPEAAPSAATAPDPAPTLPSEVDQATNRVTDDPVGFGKSMYDAVRSGKWWWALGLFLIFLTWLVRVARGSDDGDGERKPLLSIFAGDRGGLLAVGLMALFSLAGLALAGGTAPDGRLAMAVAAGALAAIGGWTGLRRMVWPKD